jgi:tight adherence protein B
MVLIVVLVFVGVLALVGLPMIVGASSSARKAKQIQNALDEALSTETKEAREQVLNVRKVDQLSTIPWLNSRLKNLDIGPRLNMLIHQADMNWTAGMLLTGSAVCFVLPYYLLSLRFKVILVPIVAGLVVSAAPICWVLFKRSRRLYAFQEGLPEALDMMVSALRAGHSLAAAMGLLARESPDPLGSEFRVCFEEQNYGLELKTALDNLTQRIPLQDLRTVCTAIMIQKESGGNLSEVLDKTAYVIREGFRLRRQIATHSAQARLTGWILTFLPVVLGFGLYVVNPEMMKVLWTNPTGVKMLYMAVIMIAIGGFVIRQIIKGIDV